MLYYVFLPITTDSSKLPSKFSVVPVLASVQAVLLELACWLVSGAQGEATIGQLGARGQQLAGTQAAKPSPKP